MTSPTPVSWALGLAGNACIILAAYLAGGHVPALAAFGVALVGIAGVLGWKANATATKG